MVIQYNPNIYKEDSEFISLLNTTSGILLLNLTLSDLACIKPSNVKHSFIPNDNRGVYLFRCVKTKQVFYVGKCSARVFIERIPMHFDIRPAGWFNQYLKYLANYLENKVKNHVPSDSEMRHALDYALNNHELLLIRCDENDGKTINGLESKLRKLLSPKLNTKK